MKKLPYPRQIAMEALFTGHGPTTFKGKEHNLSRSYLVGLFLENAIMPGVILDGSKLQKARLVGSDLSGARLVLADLQEADLRGVDLRNSTLVNTNLTCAILREADLRGADLTLANLQGAFLEGARLDGFEQLETVKSLHRTKGLPPEVASQLQEQCPHLFWKPDNPDEDPDNFMYRKS